MALLAQELTAPSKQTALFELELRTLICVETDQNYNWSFPGYENGVPPEKKNSLSGDSIPSNHVLITKG